MANNKVSGEFEQYLKSIKGKIEKEVQGVLQKLEREAGNTHKSLQPLINVFSESNLGGKKIRGTLVCFGYEMAEGKDNPSILKAAAAYEIMHASILAHDDIIDKSPFRRGEKSLYQKLDGNHYGISQTISLADIGFFVAFEMLLATDFSAKEKNNAALFFARTMQQTCLGELLDMELPAKNAAPKEKDVITIMKLKTSSYSISGPLKLGAILAGANQQLLSDFEQFGEYLGIAFQIQDDILGVFGEEREIGKSITSDITEGKHTLLFAYALEGSSERQKHTIKKYYGKTNTTPKEAEMIRNIMLETGALDYSKKVFEQNIQKAKVLVESLTDKKTKEVLNGIIKSVANRKK